MRFSKDTIAALTQYADRHQFASNQEIADFLNQRNSQTTDDELSQLGQDLGRTKTIKGRFKVSSSDVSKILNAGLGRSSKNKSGDTRGFGRLKRTVKSADKRPRNWVKEHRGSFIERRNDSDMAFTM